jgi:predicted DNA-binding transcriptional regulator AlpA
MTTTIKFEGERLLTTKQTAEMIGMQPGTLTRGRVYGNKNLPTYLKIGKAVRYKLSTIMAWMEGQREYVSTSQNDAANG